MRAARGMTESTTRRSPSIGSQPQMRCPWLCMPTTGCTATWRNMGTWAYFSENRKPIALCRTGLPGEAPRGLPCLGFAAETSRSGCQPTTSAAPCGHKPEHSRSEKQPGGGHGNRGRRRGSGNCAGERIGLIEQLEIHATDRGIAAGRVRARPGPAQSNEAVHGSEASGLLYQEVEIC